MTRRSLLHWPFLSLGAAAAPIRAQMSSRVVRPQPRGTAAGLPFHASVVDIAPACLLPARMYLDVQEAYAANEVAINWNAPLVFLLAGLAPVPR